MTADGLMGRVLWDRRRDRLAFRYEAEWRNNEASYPLSLSMPLAAMEHGHKTVEPFLWGLLPDNDGVLKRWGERFHVSPRHAFQLLSHVGEECAGGVQLVRPEHAVGLLEGRATGTVKWMRDEEIAERVNLLLKDHSASRARCGRGAIQPRRRAAEDGLSLRPGTQTVGSPIGGDSHDPHLQASCGKLRWLCGKRAFLHVPGEVAGNAGRAASAIHHFGGATVIVVERYDRVRTGAMVTRIHQEDMCQALARMPHLKYQNQGGPSPREIITLIREHSVSREIDEARFVDALIFSWLIGGTDAHAKNYSFLIAPHGQVRLAPLYDLSSALPYPKQVPPRKAALAMKIGSQYKVRAIGKREWEKFAAESRIDFEALRARILHQAAALPDAAAKVGAEIESQGIVHDVIGRLREALAERAVLCRAALS